MRLMIDAVKEEEEKEEWEGNDGYTVRGGGGG